ncbi:MAG: hypothetical protein JWO98_5347 [Frankiales bacterium]|nr:hypothetical protein [Frankiales bacterium]
MNGALSQQLALISFGNDFLKTGKLTDSFYPDNSTFQFCNNIQFIELKKFLFRSKTKEKVIAQNPNHWFEILKSEGCVRLGLTYTHSADQSTFKDYKLAGFVGGGGVWLIEAVYGTYSNFWANNWVVSDSKAVDRKIWSVRYASAANFRPTENPEFDLTTIKSELYSILIQIRDFAKKHTLTYWLDIFNKAIVALNADNPNSDYYHKDLINLQSYSLIAQQVLFSAGISFVFGGMGSWNDLGFESKEDNEIYETLTAQLYEIINNAIVAAINS